MEYDELRVLMLDALGKDPASQYNTLQSWIGRLAFERGMAAPPAGVNPSQAGRSGEVVLTVRDQERVRELFWEMTIQGVIVPGELPHLRGINGARAADWESGAIAYVAARNWTSCLILRAVTDLVGEDGGEAYGDGGGPFARSTRAVMPALLESLPAWLRCATRLLSR